MPDDDPACRNFSWDAVRSSLQGLPGGKGLNAAHEAVTRQIHGRGADVPAVRWLAADGSSGSMSYLELHLQSNRFANVLERLAVQRGKVVFSLLGRLPVLFPVIMGTLKHCNVFCPLFSSFGPQPVCQRLAQGKGEVLVTTRQQYLRKIADQRDSLKHLRHILLTDSDSHDGETLSLPLLLQEAGDGWDIPPTSPEDPALLHFTSGTTAQPKGVVHVHEAVVGHYATGRQALDFRPGDTFWCTADPGWVTGISYGVLAPLLHHVTIVFDESEFEAERWLRIIEDEKVNVLYTSPTALRRLIRLPAPPAGRRPFPQLRAVHSVGEPLDQATKERAEALLSTPVYDTWWQTETGSIMIANTPGQPARPGSMGRPLPGISATILDQQTGEEAPVDTTGMLALKSGWPSMFRGYLDDEDRYRKCFRNSWYLTGDLARRSADGYFWFKGRADDIIKSAGHLISPFEVENTLTRHPAVNEAAVYGTPDPISGETVKAAVVLNPGFDPDE